MPADMLYLRRRNQLLQQNAKLCQDPLVRRNYLHFRAQVLSSRYGHLLKRCAVRARPPLSVYFVLCSRIVGMVQVRYCLDIRCYRSSRSGGSIRSSAMHVSMFVFNLNPSPSPLIPTPSPSFPLIPHPSLHTHPLLPVPPLPLYRAYDRAWSHCRCYPKATPTAALPSVAGATPPWVWGWYPAALQQPAEPWPGTAVWPNTMLSAACTISSTCTRMVVSGGRERGSQ